MAGLAFATAGLNEAMPTSFKFWGNSSKDTKEPEKQPE